MEPREFQEVAIVIRPEKDNVAVVTVDFIEKDTAAQVRRPNSDRFPVEPLRGQSFAIKPIRRGQAVHLLWEIPSDSLPAAVQSGRPD